MFLAEAIDRAKLSDSDLLDLGRQAAGRPINHLCELTAMELVIWSSLVRLEAEPMRKDMGRAIHAVPEIPGRVA